MKPQRTRQNCWLSSTQQTCSEYNCRETLELYTDEPSIHNLSIGRLKQEPRGLEPSCNLSKNLLLLLRWILKLMVDMANDSTPLCKKIFICSSGYFWEFFGFWFFSCGFGPGLEFHIWRPNTPLIDFCYIFSHVKIKKDQISKKKKWF